MRFVKPKLISLSLSIILKLERSDCIRTKNNSGMNGSSQFLLIALSDQETETHLGGFEKVTLLGYYMPSLSLSLAIVSHQVQSASSPHGTR